MEGRLGQAAAQYPAGPVRPALHRKIAEAAFFHGRDGLLAPGARSEHPNLVVFCGEVGREPVEAVKDHGASDWEAWRIAQRGR